MKNLFECLFAGAGIVVSIRMIVLQNRFPESWLCILLAVLFTAAALSCLKDYLTK